MTTTTKAFLTSMVAIAATGCTVPNVWTTEVVDSSGNAGRHASMEYHYPGNNFVHRVAVVYEDSGSGQVNVAAIKAAKRQGSKGPWGNWTITNVRTGGAILPGTAQSPDGTIYVGHLLVTETDGSGELWLATDGMGEMPCTSPGPSPWRCELVREDPIKLDGPIAVAYQPMSGQDDRIHLIYSEAVTHNLWHSSKVGGIWRHIRVGGSFQNPTGGNAEGSSPSAFLTANILRIVFIDRSSSNTYQIKSMRFDTGTSNIWSSAPAPTGSGSLRKTAVEVAGPYVQNTSIVGRIGVATGCDNLTFNLSNDPSGNTWASATNPPAPQSEVKLCDPDLAFNSKGEAWISYFHDLAGFGGIQRQDSSPNNVSWVGEVFDNSSPRVGQYSSIKYNSVRDTMMVAYFEESNGGNLKFAEAGANR